MNQLETLLSEIKRLRSEANVHVAASSKEADCGEDADFRRSACNNSDRLENIIRVAVDALEFVKSKEQLTFAECSVAEEIMSRTRDALAEMERIAGEVR